MNDSIISEWVEAFRQEHGRPPSPAALRMVLQIQAVGKQLTERGQSDARRGAAPRPSDTFPTLVYRTFPDSLARDPQTAQTIAELWETAYMRGRSSQE